MMRLCAGKVHYFARSVRPYSSLLACASQLHHPLSMRDAHSKDCASLLLAVCKGLGASVWVHLTRYECILIHIGESDDS